MQIGSKLRLMLLSGLAPLAVMAGPALAESAAAVPAAQTVAASEAAAATAKADAAIAAFFARYDQATLDRSPQAKAYRGIRDGDYGKWSPVSDAAAKAELEQDLAFLADMRRDFAQAPLSEQARLSYRLFEKQIERKAAGAPFRHFGIVFDQMNGAQSGLPAFLVNIHRIGNKAEAEAYVQRLQGLGPVIDELIGLAGQRAKDGFAPPAWVYPHVINDARALLKGAPFEKGADSTLLGDFRTKLAALKLPAAEEKALLAQAEKALLNGVAPAYKRLIKAMEQQAKLSVPGDGIGRLKGGDAYYAERLNFHTTTDMTADEIHALGLQEVARIQSEMQALMPKLGVEGDLQDLFAFVRSSETLFYPDSEEGRAAYIAQSKAAIAALEKKLPDFFHTLPLAPLDVKRVEAFREKSAGKAFYQQPAPDGSRPGTFYANLYNMREMPIYEIEALSFHEGLPGHHLQRAIQTELKDVPAFRKFGGFTAYSEGWGLYTELLAKEMGFYQDPWQDFGRLKLDLWRAIRLVVDTGMHSKGWSREEAIKYHMDNTPSDEAEVVRAVERYAVYPGQATAYAIGKLEILRLREQAKSALGEAYNVKDFHDVVLKSGAVPLDILGESVKKSLKKQ